MITKNYITRIDLIKESKRRLREETETVTYEVLVDKSLSTEYNKNDLVKDKKVSIKYSHDDSLDLDTMQVTGTEAKVEKFLTDNNYTNIEWKKVKDAIS